MKLTMRRRCSNDETPVSVGKSKWRRALSALA